MTFSDYILKHARVSDDPIGDFILDARSDKTFPSDVATADQLHTYLRTKNACQEAVSAANFLFVKWHTMRKRK